MNEMENMAAKNRVFKPIGVSFVSVHTSNSIAIDSKWTFVCQPNAAVVVKYDLQTTWGGLLWIPWTT